MSPYGIDKLYVPLSSKIDFTMTAGLWSPWGVRAVPLGAEVGRTEMML